MLRRVPTAQGSTDSQIVLHIMPNQVKVESLGIEMISFGYDSGE